MLRSPFAPVVFVAVLGLPGYEMIIRKLVKPALMASAFAAVATSAVAQEPTLIVENGRILVGDGTVLERASVLIAGDRILSVTEDSVAHDARRIDASGMTVLPGLIDTHVHLLMENLAAQPRSDAELDAFVRDRLATRLEAYLEGGITTVMSTGDFWPAIGDVRNRLRSGDLTGPRVFTAGRIFTATGGHPAAGVVCGPWGERQANGWCREHIAAEVDSAGEGRDAVSRLAAEGVDLIKMVYDTLQPPVIHQLEAELVAEIVTVAHDHQLRTYAHVLELQNVIGAIENGLDGLVHTPGYAEPGDRERVVQLMLAEDVTASTTLVGWDAMIESFEGQGNDELVGMATRELGLAARTLSALAAADARLIAVGTDTPHLPPAEAYHRELRLISDAGLTPAEIVQAATRNAAVHMGHGDDLGTLEAGKLADLIVVDGDPLEDLSALRNVQMVVQGGDIAVMGGDVVTDNQEEAR